MILGNEHIPVLVREVLHIFEGQEIKVFFDATVGAGGHARSLLQAHREIGRYIACDWDREAIAIAKKTLAPWEATVDFVNTTFASIKEILAERGLAAVDGCLLDLGVSSMQFDTGSRGFSFRSDAFLDMRMDMRKEVTAKTLVNEWPERTLAEIFWQYGEEHRAKIIAKALVAARKKKKIQTTQELAEIVASVVRRGKIHPATKIFQALRIAVNDELGELERGLEAVIESVRVEGRVAVMSFHSLEDRIVKRRFRGDETLRVLTKKPIVASLEERRNNPRSRSAKLRAVEKVRGRP